MNRDSDARTVLDHFTHGMDAARDKLAKEEDRLAAAQNDVKKLQVSVRKLESEKSNHLAAIASLEVECARADQNVACKQRSYEVAAATLESMDHRKRTASSAVESCKQKAVEACETFIRTGLLSQRAFLGLLESCDPDRIAAERAAKEHEVTLLKAKLQSLMSTVTTATSKGPFTSPNNNSVNGMPDPEYEKQLAELEAMKKRVAENEAERQATLKDLTATRDDLRRSISDLRSKGEEAERSSMDTRRRLEDAIDGLGACHGCGTPLQALFRAGDDCESGHA